MNRRLGLACLAALVMTAPSAKADVISTLFNTGINLDGSRLADGAINPRWSITTNPDGSGTNAFVSFGTNGVFGGGGWLGDSVGAAWIQPRSGIADNLAAGTYVYTTSFDLTGFDPTTADIRFRIAADDRVAGVTLNGVSLGITYAGRDGLAAYSILSDTFTINPALLNNSLNQLQFSIVNDPVGGGGDCYDTSNPTGMVVLFTASAVPEPSTFALVGAGLGIFAFRQFRKKKTV